MIQLEDKIKKYADKIYNKFRFENQFSKMNEEFWEMGEVLHKFRELPNKANLKRAIEETADYELLKTQLERNVSEKQRIRFVQEICFNSEILHKKNLKELYIKLITEHSRAIEEVIKSKVSRTLKVYSI